MGPTGSTIRHFGRSASQLPPRTVITCPVAGHTIRTRQPPGSVLLCTACGQSGRHGVTVTVPAPLPAVRPPLPASPEGLAIISCRKTATLSDIAWQISEHGPVTGDGAGKAR
jgi:hypothetical protein